MMQSLAARSMRVARPLQALPTICRVPLARSARMLSEARLDSNATDQLVVYEGPLAKPLRILKIVSVTSCSLTLTATPLALFVGSESMTMASKVALGTVVSLFAVSTTGVLHWVSKNYVRRMLMDPATVTLTAETTSLLGTLQSHTFPVAAIKKTPNAGLFVSFTANNRPYFVHEELITDSGPGADLTAGKTISSATLEAQAVLKKAFI